MEDLLSNISVLAELERIGWKSEPAGDDEIKCLCPAHKDTSPSCTVNVRKRVWNCHAASCGAHGDFVSFLSIALTRTTGTDIPRSVVYADLCERYGIGTEKTIDMAVVEAHHSMIWKAGPLLVELYKRGLTDELLRKHRIGFHDGRISIPVFNKSGACVNIRRYLPGAPTAEKFKNVKGFGSPARLYPLDQLSYEKIIICGGEMKAVVTADRMNALGWGAIALTTGEGKDWSPIVAEVFRNKDLWICMDIDAGGVKAAEHVCGLLLPIGKVVRRVDLPLDITKYPKGDINDFFGAEKKSGKELAALLELCTAFVPKHIEAEESKPSESTKVHLSQATSATHAGKRVSMRALVTAMDETPYIIPKLVVATCERNQKFCAQCPIYAKTPDGNGSVELGLSPESPTMLGFMKSPKKQQMELIREALRMPACRKVNLRVKESYNLEDVRLVPQLEIASRAMDHVVHPCLFVGKGLEVNGLYEFDCRLYPNPRDQQAVLLAYSAKPAEDSLSQYRPTTEQLKDLDVFSCGEDVDAKLESIYTDLSTNVTKIVGRNDLHLAIDLAYHSALLVPFEGRSVKGWVEVLIVGDSSQGKSETSLYLQKHYGLGEKVECKNATVAGLLGGVVKIGERHFVQWGVIPLHDKRLVVLEELKGASQEVIAKLTDMRSSGVAEIPKIEKRRAHARTRLVAISNPRGNRPLNSYNFGVEAVLELIGGLEDLRRFDLAMVVEKNQVPAETIARFHECAPTVPHVYTDDLCRRLILWAWTRKAEDIDISMETSHYIIETSLALCNKFSEEVPLIDRGSMRLKLARLATAMAARVFSCDETRQRLVVKPCHVKAVADYLERQYSSKEFGYSDYSTAVKLVEELKNPKDVKAKILSLPFPKDFVESMLYTNEIETRDLGDWCGWDKNDAISLTSFLVRSHALVRTGNSYRKTTQYIDLLKELKDSKDLAESSRPAYVREPESKY